MKIIFMGTPDFSVPVLEGLIDNYDVIAVVTQPDKVKDRKQEITYSPVKAKAKEKNIKVIQPTKIRKEYQEILDLNPDIIITCAYGQIIPKEILSYPKYGCINVHASLLPKLRGGAPIHHAIMEGLTKTGITIMYMDEGMDTGDIITTKEIEILPEDNVGSLHDKLSILGKELLLETLPNIINGNITRIKQNNEEATYAYTIKREDELLDFNNTATSIHNKIRALNPYPVSYALLDNKIIKIYTSKITNIKTNNYIPGTITNIYKDAIGVATKDYELLITRIKPEGKKEMSVKDFLNGIDKNKLKNKVFNETL